LYLAVAIVSLLFLPITVKSPKWFIFCNLRRRNRQKWV
jgi:hypothetical protein